MSDAAPDSRAPADGGIDAALPDDAMPDDALLDGAMPDAGSDTRTPDIDAAPVTDRDEDGVDDVDDAFPDDPSEWLDSDGDGVGNAAQLDEDGDGVPDTADALPFDPARSSLPSTLLEEDGVTMEIVDAVPFQVRTPSEVDGISVFTMAVEEGRTVGFRIRGPEAAQVDVYAGSVVATALEPFDEISTGLPGERFFAWTPIVSQTFEITLTARGLEAAAVLELDVYFDQDADGLSDDTERALGLRPNNPDPDNDGLFDRAEFEASLAGDQDGDGLPAWLDIDTDGDGLFDQVEGLEDVDADGLANFLDDDSYGDGTLDADEPGVRGGSPTDTDADGRADWRDLDDDGDLLRDVQDDEPKTFDAFEDGFRLPTPFALESVAGVFAGGRRVPEVVFVDDVLEVTGEGFSATPPTSALVLYDDGRVDNVAAEFASSTQMRVRLRRPGLANVFLLRDGVRTAAAEVEVLNSGDPVIYPPDTTAYPASSRLIRGEGENLENVIQIRSDEGETVGTTFDALSSTISLSGELRGSRVRAMTSDGRTSNAVVIRALAEYLVDVDVPTGAVFDESDLTLSGYAAEEVVAPFGGFWRVRAAYERPAVVEATVDGPGAGDPPRTVLRTLVSPRLVARLDEVSTAAVTGMQLNQAWGRLDDEGLELAFQGALESPDVIALGAAFRTAATGDDDYMRNPSGALVAALEAGATAVESIMDALVPRPPLELRAEGTVTPGEQNDIRVFQTDLATANLSVENDTSLYLSAEVRDSRDQPMQAHISSYLDLAMLSPQRGLFLAFRASSGGLRAPGGRNADIDIVTPGLAVPQPMGTAAAEAQFYLRFRTIVDRILIPLISEVVSAKINPGPIGQILLVQNYDTVQDMRSAFAAGDASGAITVLINALLRDAENLGPLTQYVGRRMFGAAGVSGAVTRLGARLATNLNLLAAAVRSAATVGAAVGIGKAIADFVDTPGLLEWNVEFGLEVIGSEPLNLERKRRPQSMCLSGVGFRESGGSPADLEITNTASGFAVDVRDISVNSDGTELCFYLGSDVSAALGDVLEARISREDTGEVVRYGIPVERTLRITQLSPAELTFRERARVYGAGFGQDTSRLSVVFRDPFSDAIIARAPVLSAADTVLSFSTPRGIMMGVAYNLTVEIVEEGEEAVSNIISANVSIGEIAGTYEIEWSSTRTPDGRPACDNVRDWAVSMIVEKETTSGETDAIRFASSWGFLPPGLSECRLQIGHVGAAPGSADWGAVFGAPFAASPTCRNEHPVPFDWRAHLRQGRGRYHLHFRTPCGLATSDATIRFTPAP
ncbi:MAG: hypothetical protein AAF411_04035 [Myxococcota bacterium]